MGVWKIWIANKWRRTCIIRTCGFDADKHPCFPGSFKVVGFFSFRNSSLPEKCSSFVWSVASRSPGTASSCVTWSRVSTSWTRLCWSVTRSGWCPSSIPTPHASATLWRSVPLNISANTWRKCPRTIQNNTRSLATEGTVQFNRRKHLVLNADLMWCNTWIFARLVAGRFWRSVVTTWSSC